MQTEKTVYDGNVRTATTTPVRIMTLRFPCDVHQVDDKTVEVEMRPMIGGTILNHDAMDRLAPDLSGAEQEQLRDDIERYAVAEGFRRSIRIS